mmetsp:Transcript_3287/g.5326  ORF Transcript_3287/g.5326 Transcript_3287/m.5326 type:complete len:280 (+) Transcript_3287:120-959(+)
MLRISWATQSAPELRKSPTPEEVKTPQERPALKEAIDSLNEKILEESAEPSQCEDTLELDDQETTEFVDEEQWAVLDLDFVIKVHVSGTDEVAYVDVREGSGASVRALKLAIMLATGIPCSHQRLIHESDVLSDDHATLGSLGLEHGMSIILYERDSNQLSEADLVDLHDAFCKRVDEKFRLAMQHEEDHEEGMPIALPVSELHEHYSNQLSEAELADLREAFGKRMDEKFREAMQAEEDDEDGAAPEYLKVSLKEPLEFDGMTDVDLYLRATDQDELS